MKRWRGPVQLVYQPFGACSPPRRKASARDTPFGSCAAGGRFGLTQQTHKASTPKAPVPRSALRFSGLIKRNAPQQRSEPAATEQRAQRERNGWPLTSTKTFYPLSCSLSAIPTNPDQSRAILSNPDHKTTFFLPRNFRRPPRSNLHQHPGGTLDDIFYPFEEGNSLTAIDQAMVVG